MTEIRYMKFQFAVSEIMDQYLEDDGGRPWIIGFSGGKDSTLLLQLVWIVVAQLGPSRHERPIHVVCNDTLVENPRIVDFIDRTLNMLTMSAVEQELPITTHKTKPRLEDTFWVNLIGKGYPAPNNFFRWCTERLKINPTSKFIIETVKESGEVIVLLGTRSDESAQRAKSLKNHAVSGRRLRKHNLPKAFIYTPIKDITTNQLWQYLMEEPPPWGGTHDELAALYKTASGGDCPLVIDKSTSSCGNSRFGCWVCTVVKDDKSMEGLIEGGQDWMIPLYELRKLFKESRDRDDWRMGRRRNGQEGKGPYKPEIRAHFLEELLTAQKEIQETHGDVQLISHQELVSIQLKWYADGIYEHQVSEIHDQIYNDFIPMRKQKEQEAAERELLLEICKTRKSDADLVRNILGIQKNKSLMLRQRGLINDIDRAISEHIRNEKNDT